MMMKQMVLVGMTALIAAGCASKSAEFKRVHFALNQSILDKKALKATKQNAERMKQNSQIKMTVEGHCDEQGTSEYNIALGERRAQTIVETMTALGVKANRIQKRSWGEERPLDSGQSEKAYTQNRRAEFVVTSSEELASSD